MITDYVNTDIQKILKNQIDSLQFYAKANQVNLCFSQKNEQCDVKIYPELLLSDFVRLTILIVSFAPQEKDVEVSYYIDNTEDGFLKINLFSAGSLIKVPNEEFSKLNYKVHVQTIDQKGTNYTLMVAIKRSGDPIFENGELNNIMPAFYKKFKAKLKSHHTTIEKLQETAEALNPYEGTFLKKVNRIILANMADEHFNSTHLGRALALSRTHLYRKLKPLIRQSPGKYIRFVKMQKAKELLYDTEKTIGEISFLTGFSDQSHFTRAFKNQFGFNPSQIRSSRIKTIVET
jgi:AraC-like DNA-binding protein